MGFIALVIVGAGRDDAERRAPEDSRDPRSDQSVDRASRGGFSLATAAAICTASTLRIHPERWGALLVARTGLIGAMAGGTALFVRLIAVLD